MVDIIVYPLVIQKHVHVSLNSLKQPDTCGFFRKEVAYLGQLITQESIKPNPSKVECIFNFHHPRKQQL